MAAPQPGGDDFAPPIEDGNAASPPANPANTADPFQTASPVAGADLPGEGIGQTALIIGGAVIIAFAVLLLFLRNAIRRSLIAGRATMDSASTASWTWYFVLLVFVILVVVGLVGSLFGSLAYIGLTVGVVLVGVVIALLMTSKARRSNNVRS